MTLPGASIDAWLLALVPKAAQPQKQPESGLSRYQLREGGCDDKAFKPPQQVHQKGMKPFICHLFWNGVLNHIVHHHNRGTPGVDEAHYMYHLN